MASTEYGDDKGWLASLGCCASGVEDSDELDQGFKIPRRSWIPINDQPQRVSLPSARLSAGTSARLSAEPSARPSAESSAGPSAASYDKRSSVAPRNSYGPRSSYAPHNAHASRNSYAPRNSSVMRNSFALQSSSAPQNPLPSRSSFAPRDSYAARSSYAPQLLHATRNSFGHASRQSIIRDTFSRASTIIVPRTSRSRSRPRISAPTDFRRVDDVPAEKPNEDSRNEPSLESPFQRTVSGRRAFRPLQLSIYLPRNRLSALPDFSTLDWSAKPAGLAFPAAAHMKGAGEGSTSPEPQRPHRIARKPSSMSTLDFQGDCSIRSSIANNLEFSVPHTISEGRVHTEVEQCIDVVEAAPSRASPTPVRPRSISPAVRLRSATEPPSLQRKPSFRRTKSDIDEAIRELNTIVEKRRGRKGNLRSGSPATNSLALPSDTHIPAIAPSMKMRVRSETLSDIGSAFSMPLVSIVLPTTPETREDEPATTQPSVLAAHSSQSTLVTHSLTASPNLDFPPLHRPSTDVLLARPPPAVIAAASSTGDLVRGRRSRPISARKRLTSWLRLSIPHPNLPQSGASTTLDRAAQAKTPFYQLATAPASYAGHPRTASGASSFDSTPSLVFSPATADDDDDEDEDEHDVEKNAHAPTSPLASAQEQDRAGLARTRRAHVAISAAVDVSEKRVFELAERRHRGLSVGDVAPAREGLVPPPVYMEWDPLGEGGGGMRAPTETRTDVGVGMAF